MALDLNFIVGFIREVGEQDAGLTFEEACAHVQGQEIIGPLSKPLECDRPADTDIMLLDLPLRNIVENGGKLEQFADLILNHPAEVTPRLPRQHLLQVMRAEQISRSSRTILFQI